MKNREKLNAMTNEELASFLCDVMEKIADETEEDICEICPVSDYCGKGHNGFFNWLDEEGGSSNDLSYMRRKNPYYRLP